MTDQEQQTEPTDMSSTGDDTQRIIPKPESSSEYEGAPSEEPTGNPPVETKTETRSSSGQ